MSSGCSYYRHCSRHQPDPPNLLQVKFFFSLCRILRHYFILVGLPVKHSWSALHCEVSSEILYLLVIIDKICQLSDFDTACSSLWSTNLNRLNVATRLIKEVKLVFEKISSDIQCCLVTHRPGPQYRLLPKSIWPHFTAHFRDCLSLSKKLQTTAYYSLLFPQREYKISSVRLAKGKVICVSGSSHCSA